jgi:hypothetical protein
MRDVSYSDIYDRKANLHQQRSIVLFARGQ